eukprot:1292002-Alexandrium_andersonii.AAC.1
MAPMICGKSCGEWMCDVELTTGGDGGRLAVPRTHTHTGKGGSSCNSWVGTATPSLDPLPTADQLIPRQGRGARSGPRARRAIRPGQANHGRESQP